ncbi:hypothetical protein F2Q69_00011112 [Brassica cretica]|uniref:Uncharacterized protein n=1 Tax=Brassica cretica TaxID=69181 RepID=A0A8S9R2W0_BRACR|nr:hypothetical protein F2Q69_00011112 [Brassica cretica]
MIFASYFGRLRDSDLLLLDARSCLRRHNKDSVHGQHGFSASRVIPLDPVRQRSTSPGRALAGLDRTQYRFDVQKRQGSFRIQKESNPDGGCHHRSVLSLGLPSPD